MLKTKNTLKKKILKKKILKKKIFKKLKKIYIPKFLKKKIKLLKFKRINFKKNKKFFLKNSLNQFSNKNFRPKYKLFFNKNIFKTNKIVSFFKINFFFIRFNNTFYKITFFKKKLVKTNKKNLTNYFNKNFLNKFNLFWFYLGFNKKPPLKLHINKYFFIFLQYIFQKTFKKSNFYVFLKLGVLQKFDTSKQYDIFDRYKFVFYVNVRNQYYIFEIFHACFKFKNLKILVVWLKELFECANFYNHRYVIYFLRYFIKYLTNGLFSEFNIKGLFIKFHGKIAKAGNSRKQKFTLKYKSVGTSYGCNYLVEKFQINTFTGVIGISIILKYN